VINFLRLLKKKIKTQKSKKRTKTISPVFIVLEASSKCLVFFLHPAYTYPYEPISVSNLPVVSGPVP